MHLRVRQTATVNMSVAATQRLCPHIAPRRVGDNSIAQPILTITALFHSARNQPGLRMPQEPATHTVLIAGASGVIGAAAVEHFSQMPGWRVIGVSRRRADVPDGLNYEHVALDMQDAEACRIRVGDDIRHWEAGKSLIFDDVFNHEVWNDTDETRVILFVDVERPLPEPESTINKLLIKAIGYSPFVLDAKRNQEAWERRYRERRRQAAPAPEVQTPRTPVS